MTLDIGLRDQQQTIKGKDMAIYDKKRKTWTASVMVRGKRYRKRGFREKKFAEIWESQKKYEAEKMSVGLANPDQEKKIEQLLQIYLHNLKGKSNEYVIRENRRARCWSQFCQENHLEKFHDLSPNVPLKYQAWREQQTAPSGTFISPRTINDDLTFIRRVFKFLVRFGEIKANPFVHLPLYSIQEKEVRYLNEKEVARLLDLLEKKNKKLKDMVAVYLGTGMRRNELTSLRVCNVDLEKKIIKLNAENTKKRYSRIIPIQPKTLEILKARCQEKAKDDLVKFV